MKNYYRVMLGKASIYADESFAGQFIGTDFGIAQDLTHDLPDEWRTFNKKFIPIRIRQKSAPGSPAGLFGPCRKG